jgi:ketosteroid isomerase-like protein
VEVLDWGLPWQRDQNQREANAESLFIDTGDSDCYRRLGENPAAGPLGILKHREETMKIRSVVTLVGLAISFALPTFAQQKDTADPRIVQQRDLLGVPNALDEFGELNRGLDDAYNRNDAAAAAALFTEDALLVAPDGMFSGRQHIEQRYADAFQWSPNIDFNCSRDRTHLNAIDSAVWSAGQWFSTFQSQAGPVFAWGYWSAIYVREGDAWKIRMLTLGEHQRPTPRAETK